VTGQRVDFVLGDRRLRAYGNWVWIMNHARRWAAETGYRVRVELGWKDDRA
jgi:hypothetical protein